MLSGVNPGGTAACYRSDRDADSGTPGHMTVVAGEPFGTSNAG